LSSLFVWCLIAPRSPLSQTIAGRGHPQNRPRSARQYGWTYFVGFRCTHIHQRGARKRTKLSSNVSRVLHLRGTVRRRSGAMHSPDVAVVRGVIDPSARQRLSARPLLIRGRSAAMCIPGWRSQDQGSVQGYQAGPTMAKQAKPKNRKRRDTAFILWDPRRSDCPGHRVIRDFRQFGFVTTLKAEAVLGIRRCSRPRPQRWTSGEPPSS
jgi:hypothetical protein